MLKYIHNVLVGLDQFGNTILGGLPGETISARSGRAAQKGKLWGKAMAGWLGLIQKDHCIKAEAGDEERAHRVDHTEEEAYSMLAPEQQAEYQAAIEKNSKR